MNSKKYVLVGVFETQESLDTALETLRGQGFRNRDVSIMAPEAKGGTHGFAGKPLGWLSDAGEFGWVGKNNSVLVGGPIYSTLHALESKDRDLFSEAFQFFGISKFDAEFYEICVKASKALLAVHSDSMEDLRRAREGLLSTGAQSISIAEIDWEESLIPDLPLFANDPIDRTS